jgi:hypothetical protein
VDQTKDFLNPLHLDWLNLFNIQNGEMVKYPFEPTHHSRNYNRTHYQLYIHVPSTMHILRYMLPNTGSNTDKISRLWSLRHRSETTHNDKILLLSMLLD